MDCRKLKPLFAIAIWLGLMTAWSTALAQDAIQPESDSPQPTTDQIDAWIKELDHDRYLTREQATRKLLDAGDAALDPLLEVCNTGSPEAAERALWILGRLGHSPNTKLAIAALERLIEVRGRPRLVEKAEVDLAERTFRANEERLTPLGAVIAMHYEPLDVTNYVPVLHLQLGPKWKGNSADLQPLASLRHQLYYRFEGAPVDDDVVKFFEDKDKLARLELLYTSVTPASVDRLKKRHPDAIVYMRNDAKLGVGGENHPQGMLVMQVEDNSAAAAAGIRAGDVITSFAGEPVPDFDRLTVRIAHHRPGDTVELEILRGDDRRKLSATLKRWSELR